MRLIAYILEGYNLDIHPAPLARPWMDATPERYAYRCLPLNIANTHGWEIRLSGPVRVRWDGGPGIEAMVVEEGSNLASSHFGSGILTFFVPAIFRTDPGFDLYIQGPVNAPKDGISPLTGIVETSWLESTYTMNWLFTRPGHIDFLKGEPFCQVFPIRTADIERAKPEKRPIAEVPALDKAMKDWSEARNQFNADLKVPGTDARARKWQKHYIGDQRVIRTKLRLKTFS